MYVFWLQLYSDSHRVYKLTFNWTVSILQLAICVRILFKTLLRKLLGVQVAFPETILILPRGDFWYISISRKLRHWLSSLFHGFESILVNCHWTWIIDITLFDLFEPASHDFHLSNDLEYDIWKVGNCHFLWLKSNYLSILVVRFWVTLRKTLHPIFINSL